MQVVVEKRKPISYVIPTVKQTLGTVAEPWLTLGEHGREPPERAAPNARRPMSPPNKRQRVPTILQMEAVECGAASLCMILGYFGRIVPLEECRVECGVSRDGSKANNVLKAARKYGLEAKGFKNELEDLYDLDYPAILFWNANHFVVLEGFKKGKVYLNDPAQGPRVVTIEELDGSLLRRRASPSRRAPTSSPAARSRASRPRSGGGCAARSWRSPSSCSAASSWSFRDSSFRPSRASSSTSSWSPNRASIVKPLLLGMGITRRAPGDPHLAAALLPAAARDQARAHRPRRTSSHHILRLPVGYFAQRFAGEIGSRVAINDKVAGVVSGKLATTAIDCFMVVFYAILMFRYDVGADLHRHRRRALQRGGDQGRRARARRREPQADDRQGQAARAPRWAACA